MSNKNILLSLSSGFILLFSLITPVHSAEQFTIKTIASGLGVPWGMALLPDNTLLVTERQGQLSSFNIATGKHHTISGLPPIKVGGQGGLFDVAIPADYASEQWIYFSYNKAIESSSANQGATTLARAKLNNNSLIEWQDLLVSQSSTNTKVHYGGRISFDDQGHVFFSVGERGVRPNAQDRSNHAGSILRLNLDGSVPHDNPFIDDNNSLPEIWSYGHRNPQGLFFNSATQQLWSVEHGPRGGDEINLIKPGKNYGWPIISHGSEYYIPRSIGEGTHRDDIEPATKTYVPSIATSSIIQYQGHAFPLWQGSLLVGALKAKHINQIVLDSNNLAAKEKRLFRGIDGRIRNIIESPEGYLYISTDDGRLLHISPNY